MHSATSRWERLALRCVPLAAHRLTHGRTDDPRYGATSTKRKQSRMTQPVSERVGALLFALVAAAALLAPVIAPAGPMAMGQARLLRPLADPAFPLGTDQFGRDVLSALLYGARVSLSVGAVSTLVSLVVGTAVGLTAAFCRGSVDALLMRLTESVQVVPTFLMGLAFTSVLGASSTTLMAAIAFASWPLAARLVRSEARRIASLDYVAAAYLAGRHPVDVVIRSILPAAINPTVLLSGVVFGEAILIESAVAFLGFGDPNVMSWGAMVANGRPFLRTAPELVALPAMAIALTVVAVSLCGEALARSPGAHSRP